MHQPCRPHRQIFRLSTLRLEFQFTRTVDGAALWAADLDHVFGVGEVQGVPTITHDLVGPRLPQDIPVPGIDHDSNFSESHGTSIFHGLLRSILLSPTPFPSSNEKLIHHLNTPHTRLLQNPCSTRLVSAHPLLDARVALQSLTIAASLAKTTSVRIFFATLVTKKRRNSYHSRHRLARPPFPSSAVHSILAILDFTETDPLVWSPSRRFFGTRANDSGQSIHAKCCFERSSLLQGKPCMGVRARRYAL